MPASGAKRRREGSWTGASLENEQLMSALLANVVRRTVDERAKNPHMSRRERHRWRQSKSVFVIAELEPVIALELKYPIGCPDAPQVQEGQPKRTKVDKSVPRLQWVGDALTVILGNTLVVLCRGI